MYVLNVFKTLESSSKLLGILPGTIYQQVISATLRIGVLFCLVFNFSLSFAFTLLQPTGLERSKSFAQVLAYLLVIIWYIYSVEQTKQIGYLIDKLQELIRNRKQLSDQLRIVFDEKKINFLRTKYIAKEFNGNQIQAAERLFWQIDVKIIHSRHSVLCCILWCTVLGHTLLQLCDWLFVGRLVPSAAAECVSYMDIHEPNQIWSNW